MTRQKKEYRKELLERLLKNTKLTPTVRFDLTYELAMMVRHAALNNTTK